MLDDPMRCHASLSAHYYRRKAKADGTYDHARWQWLDGGHERCPRRVAVFKAGSDRTYGLCKVHASRRQVYPYFPPGPTCQQPCCAGERDVWSVGIWTPSRRAREKGA